MRDSIRKRWGLTLSLVIFVFAVMMTAMVIAGTVILILHFTGVFSIWDTSLEHQNGQPFGPIFAMIPISILLGVTITAFFSKKALNPIRKVIDATNRVAKGDFGVRVAIKGIYELEELSGSFNKMTQELSNTETLRSDFINNFSHEFKTPIVSIRGFAKLLKDNNLKKEEQQEYLDIIIAESERLAELSTNILNLTKYENIEIITDKSSFRLDEQIRKAILMMEPKWSAKNIEMNVEMEEINFVGNEDLTQQIFLNLIDNAIKFSEEHGTITIRLSLWNGYIRFMIKDNGFGMDEPTKAHVFDKFYQGDTSHMKAGNGLGLAIVKRIVDLHKGSIEMESEVGDGSMFIINLPICTV